MSDDVYFSPTMLNSDALGRVAKYMKKKLNRKTLEQPNILTPRIGIPPAPAP